MAGGAREVPLRWLTSSALVLSKCAAECGYAHSYHTISKKYGESNDRSGIVFYWGLGRIDQRTSIALDHPIVIVVMHVVFGVCLSFYLSCLSFYLSMCGICDSWSGGDPPR